MREWILNFELEDGNGNILKFVDDNQELISLEKEAKKEVATAKRTAWNAFINEIKQEVTTAARLLEKVAIKSSNGTFITKIKNDLESLIEPIRKDVLTASRKALRYLKDENFLEKIELQEFIKKSISKASYKYSSHLTSETTKATVKSSLTVL